MKTLPHDPQKRAKVEIRVRVGSAHPSFRRSLFHPLFPCGHFGGVEVLPKTYAGSAGSGDEPLDAIQSLVDLGHVGGEGESHMSVHAEGGAGHHCDLGLLQQPIREFR